jgi:CheY-like chemotaxis protein
MTAPRPAANGPTPSLDDERGRKAWLADLRQELLAPANAIRDLAALLVQDAAERGPEKFAKDMRKVHTAAGKLLTPLAALLDPVCTEAGPLGPKIHHQLRTPLNHILGYCELWLEDAEALLLEGFAADLRKIHDLGRALLYRIDHSGTLVRTASDPDAHVPEMIQDVVDCIPCAAQNRKSAEKGRILIVDDNDDNRDVLRRWLVRDGHTVEEAADGSQALERAAAAPCDLILLDIIMPHVNGIEALRRLKADPQLCHIPVVMISAFDEVESAVRCIELGAEDYLPKPCDRVLLEARVGACLEKKRLRDREVEFVQEIERQRRRSDELLQCILPGEVIQELKLSGTVKPRRFAGVAVFFCDIVNFTSFCDRNTPEVVVQHLHRLIETWEEIGRAHQVEKIKTIGDAFMAAAGLLRRTDDHPVLHAIRCGQAMIAATRALGVGWDLRVGVHWGPVIAGVLGRQQYLFDLWGDTVNTAARMEHYGVPGGVTLSARAWACVADRCRGESRGILEIKGKGPMEMFRVLECPAASAPPRGTSLEV